MKYGFKTLVAFVIACTIGIASNSLIAAPVLRQESGKEPANTETKSNNANHSEAEKNNTVADKQSQPVQDEKKDDKQASSEPVMKTATFGGGCFWCVEAVFVRLKGVEKVRSGFMGGDIANPTYKQVLSGLTGHAEVIQIEYDSNQISYDELLEVFWKTHDPTTLNRQGADEGTQYRSVVFYHDEDQKVLAETYKQKLNEEKVFRRPVVTEISASGEFYLAEDYHQDFYKNNPTNAYCRAVIPSKLKKLNTVFKDKLKSESKADEKKKDLKKKGDSK